VCLSQAAIQLWLVYAGIIRNDDKKKKKKKKKNTDSESLVYLRPNLCDDQVLLKKQASQIAEFLVSNKKAKYPEMTQYPLPPDPFKDESFFNSFKCQMHHSATHDFFISYCPRTETVLARALADSINKPGIGRRQFSAFLDVFCLPNGENWQESFLSGLMGSKIMVLLISEELLRGIKEAHIVPDNTLLEFDYAVQRLGRDPRAKVMVLPVWVSTEYPPDTFSLLSLPSVDEFPNVRHCHPRAGRKTIREIMGRIFDIHGIHHVYTPQVDELMLRLKETFSRNFLE